MANRKKVRLLSKDEERALNNLNTQLSIGTIIRRIADATGDHDMAETPLHEQRKVSRDLWSEQSQILLQEIDMLKSKMAEMERQLVRANRLNSIMVVSSDTGETGTSRTYDIPGVRVGSSVMAICCGQGASPASVRSAVCLDNGTVTIKFDIDPSTDHKISIWMATPDKVLV